MAFREKTSWISLVTITGIYAWYFWSLHSGPGRAGFHFGGLLETVIALAVVQTVLTVAVAVFSPREARAPRDERERLIDLRATQFAYAVLAGSVACACFFGGFEPPIVFNANTLLFILVVAEVLRSGCQVVQYPSECLRMARIRNEIRRLRFECGEMTQQQLAERIKLTRQTVNAIELGKYSPSLEAAFRIAAVFGKPLESVFHYVPDESTTELTQ